MTFKAEHVKNKEVLRKFDEIIALKANKVDFYDLREHKLGFEALDKAKNDLAVRIDAAQLDIKTLKSFFEQMQETMQTQIYEGVKKANNVIVRG